MPKPNDPFKGFADFPDLTLPERTDSEVGRAPPPMPPALAPMEIPLAPSGPAQWHQGDRVLAPWEPYFLYFGVIRQIDRDRAYIAFGDGDEGWVLLQQLRPVALTVKQKVSCRRRPGDLHLPAEILSIAGDRIEVAFPSGTVWVPLASVRIPIDPTGPGAVPARFVSYQAFAKNLEQGTRVWAGHASSSHWIVGGAYPGTVSETNDREAFIHFDDGEEGWIAHERILPLMLDVGLRVLGRWKMGRHWFPGTIAEIKNARLFIHYDDGDREWTTTAALMLPTQSLGAAAPQPHYPPLPAGQLQQPQWRRTPGGAAPPYNSHKGSSNWLIWFAVGAGLFLVRLMLRG